MTRKMFLHGAALAALLMVPGFTAPKAANTAKSKAGLAPCCATQTRCCDKVKYCCDQPEKAECCLKGIACCDKTPCCGPAGKVKKVVKNTAKKTAAPSCCASKAKG